MRKSLRWSLIALSVLAALVAGAGIYSRYFDDAGGALCGVRHEAAQIQNVKLCYWTGVSLEAMELLRTDIRHTGDPHMVLIKYADGVTYQCFWFDMREFDYSIDGQNASLIDDGCSDKKRNLVMARKSRND